ncbi:uncharacterized protein LACBIDRAFT_300127 [Laccaria bicolor S238N-H82]|uniref:Predicted protein n=1 Tax=Laccaria bicolor (strain S238N-H82 / ATCC MYA-4686) TaxID=486041 RepID=B0DG30_LACBS|nr:uncharacterized protein LACBIDRAFT_300127 [Laccaria bicolor S238N-H82]EDR06570.1 predicted protein [Laccaria bicolor S238N-H82]|eukprot:XP_001882942.1 predicted protein [Laccaria bicolor S238N-H82]
MEPHSGSHVPVLRMEIRRLETSNQQWRSWRRKRSQDTLNDQSIFAFTLSEDSTYHILFPHIVNVSLEDKVDKDQSVTVASSSGLSDKDIEKMLVEDDKACRALIEEGNKAEPVLRMAIRRLGA